MSNRSSVPREFYSEFTELPFARCIDCDTQLILLTPHVVFKHYVAQEVVFEMAICFECLKALQANYSEETVTNLTQFFESEMQKKQERRSLRDVNQNAEVTTVAAAENADNEFTVEQGLAACGLCAISCLDCHRYEIVGAFEGREILLMNENQERWSSPVMICGKCTERVSKLISKKTRDQWDRFVEEHFDGPPGIEIDGPKFDPVLI